MLLKLALKELWNNKKFVIFFMLNLGLGLACFIALDSFKNSIQNTLFSQSRGIMAADLRVGARRQLTESEDKIFTETLPQNAIVSPVTELYSMVSFETVSRLVQIKVIDDSYPFYGEIALNDGTRITAGTYKNIAAEKGIWVQPELLIQFGAKIGDTVSVGETQFKILNSVEKDSSSAWSGFAFAPRAYISKKYLGDTKLVKFGTTAYFSKLVRLPPGTDENALAKQLNSVLSDPGIDVKTHQNASEQVGLLLGYLNDYLGLTSLVALFLCALGITFFYRSFIVKRYRDVAILKSLGLSNKRILALYLIQIGILGLLSTLPALIGSKLLLPVLGSLTQDLLKIEIVVKLLPSTVILALIASIVVSLLVGWPLLQPLRKIRPNLLLQEYIEDLPWENRRLWLYLPSALVFWATSMWIAQSYIVGSSFFVAFLCSLALFTVVGYAGLIFISKLKIQHVQMRLVIRNLSRHKFATLSCFVSISLAVLLINLIPQIQNGLQRQLHTGGKTPSLFLFDIQEEQVNDLKDVLSETPILQLSPLVRARLTGINNKPFEKSDDPTLFESREQNQERRSRNRSYNLSYRTQPSTSEKIIEGSYFKSAFSGEGVPEISVEEKFADRMGIKLGDTLEFDVQGLEISGKITSVRSVNWTTFEPNFFIQFQPGVLDEAPKTFLASLPPLPLEKKASLQNAIVRKIPNISIIDVTTVIDRISEVIRQMSLTLTFMAYFSMLVGFVILYSIANHQSFERQREIHMLKILGSSLSKISLLFVGEFLLISSFASLLGIIASFLISYIFSKSFFGAQWIFSVKLPMIIFFVLQVLSFLVVRMSGNQVLKSKYTG